MEFHTIISKRIFKLLNKFTPKLNLRTEQLLHAHRYDIFLRVDFIDKCIVGDESIYYHDYYNFLMSLATFSDYITLDVEDHIKKFVKLYKSIKINGYKPMEFGYIKVGIVNPRAQLVYPTKDGLVKSSHINKIYPCLIEGAHRVAILKYLNYKYISCKIIFSAKNQYSDYTSFYDYINQMQHDQIPK